MTSAPTAQLTLQFAPEITEQFNTLREYIAHRIQVQSKPAKTIAADMDMSPSMLSRKLNPGDGDTQRFNLDDLEHYIKATGDTSAIEYLASKYLCSDASRKARALSRVEQLSAELAGLVTALKQDDRTYAPLRAAA
jgi:hypothetical protein